MTELMCSRCGERQDIEVRRFLDDDGKRKVEVICNIIVHAKPVRSVYDDPETPDSSIGAGGDSLVHQLGLYAKLIEAVYGFDGPVEYAVVEHELATAHPYEYRKLWERQGHTTTDPDSSYTLSTYLASLLGTLAREESVVQVDMDPTVAWSSGSSAAWSHPERAGGHVLTWAEHAAAIGIDPATWPATAELEADGEG